MIIKIWGTDQGDDENGGWMYSIWLDEDANTDEDPEDDGGLCTGSKLDALGMASDQSGALLARDCKHENRNTDGKCDKCGDPLPM